MKQLNINAVRRAGIEEYREHLLIVVFKAQFRKGIRHYRTG